MLISLIQQVANRRVTAGNAMFENHVPVFGYFPAHFVVNPEQLGFHQRRHLAAVARGFV
jgi:hypothetical protein